MTILVIMSQAWKRKLGCGGETWRSIPTPLHLYRRAMDQNMLRLFTNGLDGISFSSPSRGVLHRRKPLPQESGYQQQAIPMRRRWSQQTASLSFSMGSLQHGLVTKAMARELLEVAGIG